MDNMELRSSKIKLFCETKLRNSKTKLFCETSFKNEVRKLKNKLFCETSFKNDTSHTNRVTSDHKGTHQPTWSLVTPFFVQNAETVHRVTSDQWTDVLLRKVLKSGEGNFWDILVCNNINPKHSTQGFLMTWLWTRLSRWQYGNRNQDILPGLSEELSCAPSLERWFGRKKLQ